MKLTDEHLIKSQIYRFISKKMIANLPTDMEAANSLMCKKAVIAENIEKTEEQQIPLAVSNRNISVKSTDNYHSIKVCDIEKKLNTNFINGLSKTQVDEKIKELGLNVISEAKKKSIIAKFFENLNEFSTKLLVGVGLVSFVLGQFADAVAILGIAAVETILSTLQQHKAEKSLYSLKEMMVRNATVIRNGKNA